MGIIGNNLEVNKESKKEFFYWGVRRDGDN